MKDRSNMSFEAALKNTSELKIEVEILDFTDEKEQMVWAFFYLTVFLTSFFGDSLILIGTIHYSAIRQHKVIIATIQHLAVIDLMATALFIFPKMMSLIKDNPAFGEFLCHASPHIWNFCLNSLSLLTCALSTFKLMIVKYPLRTGRWTSKFGHKICCAVFFLNIILHFPGYVIDVLYVDTIFYYHIPFRCTSDFKTRALKLIEPMIIAYSILNVLIYAFLITTSAALIKIAKKASTRVEPLRWKGVTTVLLTVGVFLLSTMPFQMVSWATLLNISADFDLSLARTTHQMMALNIMSNFFVYCLTLRSFREFLKLRISKLVALLRKPSTKHARYRPPLTPIPRRKFEVSTHCEAIRYRVVTKRDVIELREMPNAVAKRHEAAVENKHHEAMKW